MLLSRLNTLIPLAALATLTAAVMTHSTLVIVQLFCGLMLLGAVITAVHHAEVIARRIGEPFGTLVLALSVTIIEVALIVSMLLAGGDEKATLIRDTVYSTVMIITTGVIGLSLLVGGIAHREQVHLTDGARPALSILMALAVLTLVLPVFTTSTASGTYSKSQLVFDGAASLILWGVFIFGQTIRHRNYFIATDDSIQPSARPSAKHAWQSFAFLAIALIAVVGLAKVISPSIEAGLKAIGAPHMMLAILIALIVLLPESISAVRAAAANRLQTSINLALGSALASIGLTIPVVVAASVLFNLPLELGLDNKDIVLLTLSLIISGITLSSSRTTIMQGALHLVLFAAFLVLTLIP